MDKTLKEEALALARETGTAAIASVENDGPWIRIMAHAKIDDDFTLWYATFSFSNKIRQFEKNNRVCVVFYKNPFYLRLFGKVDMVRDQNLKGRMWRDQWMQYFKGGKEDPTYTLFKVIPEKIEYRNKEKYGPVAKDLL